jgi:2-hydroxy-6-oxo-octa-2,4-dienoate hydrolase
MTTTAPAPPATLRTAEITANGIRTTYLEAGEGPPVVLIHGSGPGVNAFANWRVTIPGLSPRFRCLAPDMVGFGTTERPDGVAYDIETWTAHLLGFLDALGVEKASLVGNSFGGAISMRFAVEHPERVDRLVLMGSAGVSFPVTDGLDLAWGYTPSLENMRHLLDTFAFSRALVTDELAQLRYEASIQPGIQEAFSSMFPPPRQKALDALATPREQLEKLPHETLIFHGRDDRVVPLSSSLQLLEWIPKSRLHVFSRSGHWTQIEWAAEFNRILGDFLADSASAS